MLKIDPERTIALDHCALSPCHINVRATEPEGFVRAADLMELELESLIQWVTEGARTNDDPEFALRTLALAFGHDPDEITVQLEVE